MDRQLADFVSHKRYAAFVSFRMLIARATLPRAREVLIGWKEHAIAVTTALSKTLCWDHKKEAGIWSRKKAELLLLDSAPHATDELQKFVYYSCAHCPPT